MIEPKWNNLLGLNTYSERGLAEFILGSESHPEFQALCANIVKYFRLPENSRGIRTNGQIGPAVYLSAGSCYVYCRKHDCKISQKLEDAVKRECFDKGYPEPPEITQYEAAQREAVRDRELAELKSILAQVGQTQPVSTEKQGIIEGLGEGRARGGNQETTEWLRTACIECGCTSPKEASRKIISRLRGELKGNSHKGPFTGYTEGGFYYGSGTDREYVAHKNIYERLQRFLQKKMSAS